MNSAITAIWTAAVLALSLASTAAAQDVDGRTGTPTADSPDTRFRSTMDRVFAPGAWRETSGYRTPAEEEALRREGAGVVPPGRLSHHSLGSPDAPGAYDVVVRGMSTRAAAEKLRRSGEPLSRVIAEAAHGPEGPHLHIEPRSDLGAQQAPSPPNDDNIYLRIVGGRRNPQLARGSMVGLGR